MNDQYFSHFLKKFGEPQQVVAILSVSCPLSTYTEEQFKTEIAQDVMQHANQISKFIYL